MKNFIRFWLRMLLYPFSIVAGWLYKHYMRIAKKKKIAIKYGDIVDGFSYLIMTDPKVEEVAKERASICAKCPHASYIAGHKNTVVVEQKEYTYKSMKCNACECALAAKVRAMDNHCPLNKWPEVKNIV
jgi:hypothetical protein